MAHDNIENQFNKEFVVELNQFISFEFIEYLLRKENMRKRVIYTRTKSCYKLLKKFGYIETSDPPKSSRDPSLKEINDSIKYFSEVYKGLETEIAASPKPDTPSTEQTEIASEDIKTGGFIFKDKDLKDDEEDKDDESHQPPSIPNPQNPETTDPTSSNNPQKFAKNQATYEQPNPKPNNPSREQPSSSNYQNLENKNLGSQKSKEPIRVDIALRDIESPQVELSQVDRCTHESDNTSITPNKDSINSSIDLITSTEMKGILKNEKEAVLNIKDDLKQVDETVSIEDGKSEHGDDGQNDAEEIAQKIKHKNEDSEMDVGEGSSQAVSNKETEGGGEHTVAETDGQEGKEIKKSGEKENTDEVKDEGRKDTEDEKKLEMEKEKESQDQTEDKQESEKKEEDLTAKKETESGVEPKGEGNGEEITPKNENEDDQDKGKTNIAKKHQDENENSQLNFENQDEDSSLETGLQNQNDKENEKEKEIEIKDEKEKIQIDDEHKRESDAIEVKMEDMSFQYLHEDSEEVDDCEIEIKKNEDTVDEKSGNKEVQENTKEETIEVQNESKELFSTEQETTEESKDQVYKDEDEVKEDENINNTTTNMNKMTENQETIENPPPNPSIYPKEATKTNRTPPKTPLRPTSSQNSQTKTDYSPSLQVNLKVEMNIAPPQSLPLAYSDLEMQSHRNFSTEDTSQIEQIIPVIQEESKSERINEKFEMPRNCQFYVEDEFSEINIILLYDPSIDTLEMNNIVNKLRKYHQLSNLHLIFDKTENIDQIYHQADTSRRSKLHDD